jgi:hypothetical protein
MARRSVDEGRVAQRPRSAMVVTDVNGLDIRARRAAMVRRSPWRALAMAIDDQAARSARDSPDGDLRGFTELQLVRRYSL